MSVRDSQDEAVRCSFRSEGTWLQFSSPLFSALLRASAQDDDLVELCSASRPGQPVGLLFPIVAHYLLLKSPDAQLARYFPSLTTTPDPAHEAFPTFREFCLDRRQELGELLAWRTVNTNLVERASCILPTLAYVNAVTMKPLTLVEICCSSGLNLLFDEYRYDYGPAGSLGNEGSAVQLACKITGSARPPIDSIPRVAQRIGVDLVTVNTSDPDERLWMEAALCPEWSEQRERLRAALAVRMTRAIRMVRGDALEVLPSLLAELPGPLCVLHSYCMGQWSAAAKGDLDDILRAASHGRDIHRVGLDTPDHEAPETIRARLLKLVAAGIPLQQKSFPSRIEYTRYVRRDTKTQLLGQADGFGGWLDWCASPPQ